MDTTSESETWDRSQGHNLECHEANCKGSARTSDEAQQNSKKLNYLTKMLLDMKRDLSKVDQRLDQYRDKNEVMSMLRELKESNNSTSERQVSALKTAVDEMKEKDQLKRVEKMASELEELREMQNKQQMERRELEASLQECKNSKEKLRRSATKVVRHWKAKCMTLQTQFQTEKDLQAAKEKEGFQDQFKVVSQQTDAIQTELKEVLSRLAQHKEELHHKYMELHEASQLQLSLKQETQEVRETLAALKEENQSQAALQAWLKEHQRLEEQAVCCCQRNQDMLGGFQSTPKMTPAHAQVVQQLAKEENARKELQGILSELEGKLTDVQEERAALEQQLQLERKKHQKQVHNIKPKVQDSATSCNHDVQHEMQSHLKEVKQGDNELTGMLRAMLKRTKQESDQMAAQLRKKDEAFAHLQKKCQQLRKELDEKVRSNDQRYILELEEKLVQKEEQKEKIISLISAELDAICSSVATNCKYKKAISQGPTSVKNIPHWLAETMTKLRWLCEEVRECVSREQCLRKQLQKTRDHMTQPEDLIQSSSAETDYMWTDD